MRSQSIEREGQAEPAFITTTDAFNLPFVDKTNTAATFPVLHESLRERDEDYSSNRKAVN